MPRKDTYQQWEADGDLTDNLVVMQSLSRQGYNMMEIAKAFDITDRTLRELKNKYTSVASALKKGRRHVVAYVENALMERIRSGDTIAIIYALKVYGGEFYQDQKEMISLRRREVEIMQERTDLEKNKFEQTSNIDIEALIEATKGLAELFNHNLPALNISDYEE